MRPLVSRRSAALILSSFVLQDAPLPLEVPLTSTESTPWPGSPGFLYCCVTSPATEPHCCKAIPIELWHAHTQKDGGIYVLPFFIYVHLYIHAPMQYKCWDLLNCLAKIIECTRPPCSCKIPLPELSATHKIPRFYSKIKCSGHFTTTFLFFSCKMWRAAQRKIVFLVPLPRNFALTLALHSHYYICYSECP
jgi:hypothetical protein